MGHKCGLSNGLVVVDQISVITHAFHFGRRVEFVPLCVTSRVQHGRYRIYDRANDNLSSTDTSHPLLWRHTCLQRN
jgi:hypothetical protein